MFTPDEIEHHFTQNESTAQQKGLFSLSGWKNSIEKMKVIQFVDDAAKKF